MTTEYRPSIVTTLEVWVYHQVGKLCGTYRIAEHEKLVADAVCRALPQESMKRLQAQCDSFNHISHACKGQVVGFASVRGFGYKDPPKSSRFACEDLISFPLASATLRRVDGAADQSTRVDLYISSGWLSEMAFERKPRDVFGARHPSPEQLEIADLQILFDPMDPDPFPTRKTHDVRILPEWLRKYAATCEATTIHTALEPLLRARILKHYGLEFPPDYVELLASVDYVRCHPDFEVLGASQMWCYVTPQEYVVKLAEIEGHGALCLLRGREAGIYYVDNEDHVPIPVGNSFREALEAGLSDSIEDWKARWVDYA